MDEIINSFNYSFTDFDQIETIELFLSQMKSYKKIFQFEFQVWIKDFGEKFQEYGRKRRILKEEDCAVLYKDLSRAYNQKLSKADLLVTKLMEEKYLSDQSIKLSEYNEKVKSVEKFINEKYDGSDEMYLEYFLESMSVGRKVVFIESIDLPEEDRGKFDLVGNFQMLRAIWKLEDFFSQHHEIKRYLEINQLLVKAYSLIGVDTSKIAVDFNLLIINGKSLLGDEGKVNYDELSKMVKSQMIDTGNLEVKLNMKKALLKMNLWPMNYDMDSLSSRFILSVLESYRNESFQALMNLDEGNSLETLLESVEDGSVLSNLPNWLKNFSYEILIKNQDLLCEDLYACLLREIYYIVFKAIMQNSQ